MRIKMIMLVIYNFLLLTITLADGVDNNDAHHSMNEEGGIHTMYDESQWKDPHDALGEFSEQHHHQQQQQESILQQRKQKPDAHAAADDNTGREEKSGAANPLEPPEKMESMKHSYIDDKVYFRHLMRIFTERFERLEGEEHKYGVQLMMLETHYVEIKQLLEDNSSSNKQIFDLMSKAFQPLSRSPIAPLKSYMTLRYGMMGFASLITIYLTMLLGRNWVPRQFHLRRSMMYLFVVMFIFSVPWEWYRMYKVALSKKTAEGTKLFNIPDACRPDDLSFISSLKLWLNVQFSMSDDECQIYHESILVDPLWEVTPIQAFSVCFSRLLLEPLKQVASAGGVCFRLFFKEVPAQWQPFLFIAVFVIIVLLIITQAGFEIWTPLLRLVVRRPNLVEDYKRLELENQRLVDNIQRLELANGRQAIQEAANRAKDNPPVENVGAQAATDLPPNRQRLQNVPPASPEHRREPQTVLPASPRVENVNQNASQSAPRIEPLNVPLASSQCIVHESTDDTLRGHEDIPNNQKNDRSNRQQHCLLNENENVDNLAPSREMESSAP